MVKDETKEKPAERYPNLLVVIGASAGGMEPLGELLAALPKTFQGTILVATHRSPEKSSNMLRDILARRSNLLVREPIHGEKLMCTTIYVGKSDEVVKVDGTDMAIEKLSKSMKRMERIDDLFLSAALSAGKNTIGIILSGLLDDGVRGLKAIHDAGGRCFAQDPSDADFTSMPEKAIKSVPIDYCGTAKEIAERLTSIVEDRFNGVG